MIRHLSRLLFFTLCISLSNSSFASFGFGPCCGGFTCGIIPCDTGCSGAAFSSMGSTVSSLYKQWSSLLDDMTKASNDVNSELVDVGVNISNVLTSNHRDVISGLDAKNKTVLATLDQQNKTIQNTGDASIASISNTLKSISIYRNEREIDNMFLGSTAQPATGVLLPNHAKYLKSVVVQRKQVELKFIEAFSDYYDYMIEMFYFGGKNIAMKEMSLVLDDIELNNPSFIFKGTLSEDDFEPHVNYFFTSFLGMNGIDNGLFFETKGNDLYYSLSRANKPKIMFLMESLAVLYSGYIGIPGAPKRSLYFDYKGGPNGNLSQREYIESMVMGPLLSESWYEDVKILNESGLMREYLFTKKLNTFLTEEIRRIDNVASNIKALNLMSEK